MADVECPECGHDFDVYYSEDWDDSGFVDKCPKCGAFLIIEVEIEYSYCAELDDQKMRAREETDDAN